MKHAMTTPLPRSSADPARGSAMIITLMVLALVTALSTTVAVVTINNLQSSTRAQQSGAAVGAADAGLAQALTYLRKTGVRDIKCTVPANAECSAAWGSVTPMLVTVPGQAGQSYQVWIEAVQPFPANNPGRYRVHSTGSAGGKARREVVTDVAVGATSAPLGIFARSVRGGGSASVTDMGIFSTGCVFQRRLIYISGKDAAYGIPAAVHSASIITNARGTGRTCTASGAIHDPVTHTCDMPNRYDQDQRGGSLTSTTCTAPDPLLYPRYPDYYDPRDLNGDGSVDVEGSKIKDMDALQQLFGFQIPPLSEAQIEQMKALAVSQNNYHTSASGWTSPTQTNAVLFFELPESGNNPSINLNAISEDYGRASGCNGRSLSIVVKGGDVTLNSNRVIAASLFLLSEDGAVDRAIGTANFIGTIFADTVDMSGNVNFSLDPCFMTNLSPSLLDFKLSRYRELDR